jgi:hypothetical protein
VDVDACEPPPLRFLVEWYASELTTAAPEDVAARLDAGAAAASAEGSAVQLLVTVSAPTDDVVYGVFAADTAEAVLDACRRVGWPPDRITGHVREHIRVPEQFGPALA